MSHSKAVRLYEQFTELPVDGTFDGDIPQPVELDLLGELEHVVYISNKWHEREGRTGKKDEYIRYIHDFKKNKPLLCYDRKTRSYHIIGKVNIKPEGITDFKGAHSGNSGKSVHYSIPKTLTYLGYLEDISYTSAEDDEEYKIEFGRNAVLVSNPSGLKLYIAKMKR